MVEPEPAHDPCCYLGPAATRCPGYEAAPVSLLPERLSFLTFLSDNRGQPGCAHLVAQRTSRGGFRGHCAHPDGCPSSWPAEMPLTGHPVSIAPPVPRQAVAQ